MDKETSRANTALLATGSIRTVTGWILDNYWDDKQSFSPEMTE